MKIEQEKILLSAAFNPRDFDELKPDQKEMLALFARSASILEVVQHFFSKRQLVSFVSLHELVLLLLKKNAIANMTIQQYFSAPLKTQSESGFFDRLAEKLVEMQSGIKVEKNKIKEIPFFRSLGPDLQEIFLQNSLLVPVSTGITFCQEGAKQRSLLVLLSGQATVYKKDSNGQLVKVVVLTKGSVFGEVAFFFGTERNATVVADQDCQVLVIKYVPEVFDSLLKKDKAMQLQKRIWTIQALQKAEAFKSLPQDCFDALIFAGELKSFKPKTMICKQGEVGENCYVIIQGAVDVVKNLKFVNRLEQGDCFGELALMMNQGIRTASIHSVADGMVLEIHRSQFYKMLAENLLLACEFEKMAIERTVQNQRLKV